jgi:Cys-rich repeat protein
MLRCAVAGSPWPAPQYDTSSRRTRFPSCCRVSSAGHGIGARSWEGAIGDWRKGSQNLIIYPPGRIGFEWGSKMTATKRAIQFALFLVIVLAFPTASRAQLFPSPCTTNAQCPDGFTCQPGFFGRYCLFEFCNADTECSRPGARCTNGICRVPVGGGGAGGGSGTRPSGEGGRCGPQNFGGVIKSIGCRSGLQCRQGICRRPLQ